jgi:hypothetical protein
LDRAEEGLLHVMGVLRERNEVRAEIGEAALRLQQSLNADAPGADEGAAQEDWERLRSQQNNVLEGESRRSDLDRDDPLGGAPSGIVKGGLVNS